MPMRREEYPEDWEAISRAVRERAGNRCEWCGAVNGRPHPRTGSVVVLTTAHLGLPHPGGPYPWGHWGDKRDKRDVRDGNLAALCQRCHLAYDHDDHVRHAAATRRRRALGKGGARD